MTSSKLVLDSSRGHNLQSAGQLTGASSFLQGPSSTFVVGLNCSSNISEVVVASPQPFTQNGLRVSKDWKVRSHSSQTSPSSTLQPNQLAANPTGFDEEGRNTFNQVESELTDGSMILESSHTDSTDEIVVASSTTSTGIEPPEIPDTPTRELHSGAPHSPDQSSPSSFLYNLNSRQTSLPLDERRGHIQVTGSSQLSDKVLGKRTIHPLVCCVACGKKLLKPQSRGDKPTWSASLLSNMYES